MIEILETGFLADFVLELMDRAGSFDGLDAAATSADQVVAMLARNQQREICGALVQAEAADHTVLSEQADDRRLEPASSARDFGRWLSSSVLTSSSTALVPRSPAARQRSMVSWTM